MEEIMGTGDPGWRGSGLEDGWGQRECRGNPGWLWILNKGGSSITPRGSDPGLTLPSSSPGGSHSTGSGGTRPLLGLQDLPWAAGPPMAVRTPHGCSEPP